MAKKLYGTDPDQVPTNADLGTAAYVDLNNQVYGPAFRYFADTGANQSVPSGTQTLVLWPDKSFDTNDAVSSSRFTAPVAGIYFFNAAVLLEDPDAGTVMALSLYKNGARILSGDTVAVGGANENLQVMSLQKLAIGDYIEVYAYQNSGSAKDLFTTLTNLNEFSGFMVRGA